jgi:hypothetical protein
MAIKVRYVGDAEASPLVIHVLFEWHCTLRSLGVFLSFQRASESRIDRKYVASVSGRAEIICVM